MKMPSRKPAKKRGVGHSKPSGTQSAPDPLKNSAPAEPVGEMPPYPGHHTFPEYANSGPFIESYHYDTLRAFAERQQATITKLREELLAATDRAKIMDDSFRTMRDTCREEIRARKDAIREREELRELLRAEFACSNRSVSAWKCMEAECMHFKKPSPKYCDCYQDNRRTHIAAVRKAIEGGKP